MVGVDINVPDVKSNLASGMRITQAGNRIILDEDGSYIENKRTGNRITIRHENGCFMFDLWVPAAKRKDGNGATSGKKGQARTSNRFAAVAPGENTEDMGVSTAFVRQEP